MREFKIAELSCVDRPAQQGARAVLMKRHTTEEETDMQFEKIASFDTFEAACEHLRKVCGMAGSDAMAACARRYPELLAKFQKGAPPAGAPPTPVDKAVADFQLAVDEVGKRDQISRSEAMGRVARERPELYAAYQQSA